MIERHELDGVVEDARRSVAISNKVVGPRHPLSADRRFNLAMAFYDLGQLDDALGEVSKHSRS